MNKRGQATTEMMFIMPLLIMIIGAALCIVYSCWQGIKVQQAANLAARIQGQERVSGGTDVGNIEQENGVGTGMAGDDDPTASGQNSTQKFNGQTRQVNGNSVYAKFYTLIKSMFPGDQSQVFIPPPLIGQNVDQVKVVRLINLKKIPFMNWFGAQQVQLVGTAWGGEDTYMYALPRWGSTGGAGVGTSGGDPEYVTLLKQSASAANHDQ